MDVTQALQALGETSELLDEAVAELPAQEWLRPTPAEGWSIADQIGHLLWTDEVTLTAITDPEGFRALVAEASRAAESGQADLVDRGAHERGSAPADELLAAWRSGRRELQLALAAADPAGQIPWFGPPMRPVTIATARTMETWAHALDVFDALGRTLPATSALWAVARLGVRTREFAFKIRGLPVPAAEPRVELEMPGGARFEAGPEGAADRVTGSGWAFAAVVTQRRNIADVELVAQGEGAAEWMRVAQAFAGAPTSGPAPGARIA